MAQLGARFHGMEEVIGSIPIRSTKHPLHNLKNQQPEQWGQCEPARTLVSTACIEQLLPMQATRIIGLGKCPAGAILPADVWRCLWAVLRFHPVAVPLYLLADTQRHTAQQHDFHEPRSNVKA